MTHVATHDPRRGGLAIEKKSVLGPLPSCDNDVIKPAGHGTYLGDLVSWYACLLCVLACIGLDYPPLTAYGSWACGAVAHRINPAFVALGDSHGTAHAGVPVPWFRPYLASCMGRMYRPSIPDVGLRFMRTTHDNSFYSRQFFLLTAILFTYGFFFYLRAPYKP